MKTSRYSARYVLELLGKGRISLSKAAELLDSHPLAVIEKARERGVELLAREAVLAPERAKPCGARRHCSRARTSSRRQGSAVIPVRRYIGARQQVRMSSLSSLNRLAA